MPFNTKVPLPPVPTTADVQRELLQTAQRQLETWQRIENKLDMLFNRIARLEERSTTPSTVGVDKFPHR